MALIQARIWGAGTIVALSDFGASAAAFALVGSYWSVMFFQPQDLQDVRARALMTVGMGLGTLGLLALTQIDPDSSYSATASPSPTPSAARPGFCQPSARPGRCSPGDSCAIPSGRGRIRRWRENPRHRIFTTIGTTAAFISEAGEAANCVACVSDPLDTGHSDLSTRN